VRATGHRWGGRTMQRSRGHGWGLALRCSAGMWYWDQVGEVKGTVTGAFIGEGGSRKGGGSVCTVCVCALCVCVRVCVCVCVHCARGCVCVCRQETATGVVELPVLQSLMAMECTHTQRLSFFVDPPAGGLVVWWWSRLNGAPGLVGQRE
jgi:hypothetical protein